MVHSAVLLNLQDTRTDFLTYNLTILQQNLEIQNKPALNVSIPTDDIIELSASARFFGIPMHISNTKLFGFIMVPLDETDPISKDMDQLTNIKIFIINDVNQGIVINEELVQFAIYPMSDKLSLSRIFMINLERRPERRQKMDQSFLELGLDVEYKVAVDGNELTDESLKEMGVKLLTGYEDPFHNRPMTMGEIGCFLSHYSIWQTIVEQELNDVLVLEDDIRFEPYFKERASLLLDEARSIGGWDLMYIIIFWYIILI